LDNPIVFVVLALLSGRADRKEREKPMNKQTTRPNPKTDPEGWKLYWQEQIKAAQSLLEYEIAGNRHSRVPFGQECDDAKSFTTCHDCAAKIGQLHVPGCDVEVCAVCGGQAISCKCDYAPYQAISQERINCEMLTQRLIAEQETWFKAWSSEYEANLPYPACPVCNQVTTRENLCDEQYGVRCDQLLWTCTCGERFITNDQSKNAVSLPA
jgi:hypothetical protein